MVVASQLVAKISTDGYDKAKSDMEGMDKATQSTSGGLKGLLANSLAMAGGFAIFNVGAKAVGFLKDQFSDAMQLAIQHNDIMTQTAQAIKSTGDASGMTAQAIADLAEKQQDLTGISKDTIQRAEDLELTFTGIGKNTFPLVLQAAEDMATAMHEDLSSAMMQVAKATNDPAQGLTMLTREGVTFTDQQKAMVKQLEASGDTMDAQKLMLGELQKEFGGSAQAAGKTFGGQLQILQDRLNDTKEKIATALIPVLQQLTGFVSNNILPALEGFSNWFVSTGLPAIENFSNNVKQKFISAVQDANNWVHQFINSHKDLRDALENGVDAIKKSAIGFYDWVTSGHAVKDIMNALQPAIAYLSPKFKELGEAFAHLKEVSMPLVKDLAQLGQSFEKSGIGAKIAHDAFAGIVVTIGLLVDGTKGLVTGISNVVTWFTTGGSNAKWLWDMFAGIGNFLKTTFKPVWDDLVRVFNTQVKPAIEGMIPALQPLLPVLGGLALLLGATLVGALKGGIQAIAAFISGVAQAIGGILQIISGALQFASGIISFFTDLFSGHFDKLGKDLDMVMNGIATMIAGVWNTVTGVFNATFNSINALLTGFISGFIGFFQFLYDELIGHSIIPDIVHGLIDWFGIAWGAIVSVFGTIGNWFHDRFTEAYNGIKNALDGVGGWVHDHLVAPFTNGLATIGGVFSNIAKLISDATTGSWTAIPGDLHSLHVPGFAEGGIAPGGFAMVGERGPELTYLPRGTRVIPNNQLQSFGSAQASGGGQNVYLQVDGHTFARLFMPYMTGQIRNTVGIWGM